MSKARGSPRKFSEKIALLNKKEAEATAEFEKILKEVEETTRAPLVVILNHGQQQQFPLQLSHHLGPHDHNQSHNHSSHNNQESRTFYGLPQRSSSFSNWQRCDPLQPPSQQQQLAQGQYLTQDVQYNSNHMHAPPVFVDHRQPDQSQQRPYIDLPTRQPFQQHVQQQQRQLPAINLGNADQHMQSASLRVPNIEIFPIDDDQSYQQVSQQQTPHPTNIHHRQACSTSSISSARSLPNIANLSVSPTTNGFYTQLIHSNNQQLMPTSSGASQRSSSPASPSGHQDVSSSGQQISSESYAMTPADYYNSDEYCSLPAVHEPLTLPLDPADKNRTSQTSLTNDGSWQSVVLTNSAPCSAAPTPPSGVVQPVGYDDPSQQQQYHSPNSTSRQHSPQHLLHQDYYPTQQLQQGSQAQMTKASSTNNIINKYPTNELLEAPRQLNNHLSKSSDAYYDYLDDYVLSSGLTDEDAVLSLGYSNSEHTGEGLNFGQSSLSTTPTKTTSSLVRSRCRNVINPQNDCKHDQCADTTTQFFDTPQYPFYG